MITDLKNIKQARENGRNVMLVSNKNMVTRTRQKKKVNYENGK